MSKTKNNGSQIYNIGLQVFDSEEDLEMIEDALEDGVITEDELINIDL